MTLVFVSSRGACEQLTTHLNEAYAARFGVMAPAPQTPVRRESREMGIDSHTESLTAGVPVPAKAHHGSVPKGQCLGIEWEPVAGELRCVVVTASLELSTDIGSVDLVLQVAPSLSVATGLQRVRRADHRVGGRSRDVICPVEHTRLVGAAVATGGMRTGMIERTGLVPNALDVLVQQTVAAVSVAEESTAEVWFITVRRAAPYASSPCPASDSVLELLVGGFVSADLAGFSSRIVWDCVTGELNARPNAQRLVVVSSETIPDQGTFSVALPEGAQGAGRRRVGELNEEMVHESSPGDIITLETSGWQIRQIAGDRIVVDPAKGRSAHLSFQKGEGLDRLAATGLTKGVFLRKAQSSLPPEAGTGESGGEWALRRRPTEAGLNAHARSNLLALPREQYRATGALSTDRILVLECCEDESGSW